MTAPALTKPRKLARRSSPAMVTHRGPDMATLEQVVREYAEHSRPMISRQSVARERAVTELRILETEKQALAEKRSLADRLYHALTTAIDEEERDIDAVIDMNKSALLDGAEQADARG